MLDSDIDPDIPVQQLGVAQRQLVEIARALSVDAKLIIMDEPTAALSEKETLKLFEAIRALRAKGVGIIYISHYLEEFGQIGDMFSVLRDGELVGNGRMDSATPEQLIKMMVGREIKDLYPKTEHTSGKVLFAVDNLSSSNGTHDVRFKIQAGEVVGYSRPGWNRPY